MRSFGLPWPEFNDGLTYDDFVSSSDSGLTLIQFYSTKHKSSAPLPGWLQRIHNGQITVNGDIVTDPDISLRDGSELVYHRLPWREPDAPYLLEVLYEDDEMLALNKPSGLQVLPGGLFQQRTALMQLQWHSSKNSALLPCQESNAVPVHRLGRGTSGVLLCAKTKKAKACLASYFADGTSVVRGNRGTSLPVRGEKRITKIYRALASGILETDEILVNQPIGAVRYPGVAKGLYMASPAGKSALSKVTVLERDTKRNQTLVQVEIQSGRPHQIRIHMSFIGHPLVDDPLYMIGGKPNCFGSELADESFAQDGGYQRPQNPVPGDCGYHLHAHHVKLIHPTSHEELVIIAPLPPMLRTSLEMSI
ncbi:hypothetical protein V2J09_001372 [Rumex salicifolius]